MTSFDDQFDDLWRIAYRVAFRVLGVREDAEDVAQDALVRVGLRWRTVSSYAAPFTARVAGQRAIDVWRRRQRRPPDPAPPHAGPATSELEVRDALVQALRRLPTRQRQTVILRYLADFDEHATADALGCSEGTVKTHAARGLAALRTTLAMAEPTESEVD